MAETLQRKIILEELCRFRRHYSAMEVYERVKRRIPQISFATVYRNLKLLREKGLALELTLGKDASLWDGLAEPHYHFTCKSCGEVSDMPVEYDSAWERTIARKAGFAITGHRAEFYGYCDKCKDKASIAEQRAARPRARISKEHPSGHRA
ncbi:MAG: transcriptional repressor [Chloroflexota bacterium]